MNLYKNQTRNQEALWHLTLMLRDCDMYIMSWEYYLKTRDKNSLAQLLFSRFWRTSATVLMLVSSDLKGIKINTYDVKEGILANTKRAKVGNFSKYLDKFLLKKEEE